jgi:hypothetical protein
MSPPSIYRNGATKKEEGVSMAPEDGAGAGYERKWNKLRNFQWSNLTFASDVRNMSASARNPPAVMAREFRRTEDLVHLLASC